MSIGKILLLVTLLGALPQGAGAAPAFTGAACKNGIVPFGAVLQKEFDRAAEKFMAMKEAEIRRVLAGNRKELFELELLAVPAIPDNYPFKFRRMSCWIPLYDFLQAIQEKNEAEAAEQMGLWEECVNGFYEQALPQLAKEILVCYAEARGLQKNLPKQAKPKPVAPQPAPPAGEAPAVAPPTP